MRLCRATALARGRASPPPPQHLIILSRDRRRAVGTYTRVGNMYTSQYHTQLEGTYIYNNIYYYTIMQYCIAITTVTIIYYTMY